MWPLKAALWSTKLLSKHVAIVELVSTCEVPVYTNGLLLPLRKYSMATKMVQRFYQWILLSPTCCIACFKPFFFFLSVLIEQLSRTSKDNRIHDTIQSATESNIMQHSQVDSTLPPRLLL